MVGSKGWHARRRTALALVALLLPGCAMGRLTFDDGVPDGPSVAAIKPGHTTRQQVLHLLGPPEEYAQPVSLFGLRAWDPQQQRVFTEHDVFRRRTWTWLRETRSDLAVGIPLLFTWIDTDHQAERVVVTFDQWGVVTAVGDDLGEAAQ
jgi:outer membrane protein assembly factor BamE (lipoprotein component of BamABCDE complex)